MPTYTYPFLTLGNGVPARPMVPILVHNPVTNKAMPIFALVDTGADKSILPEYIPTQTGYKLKDGIDLQLRGIL